MMASASTLSKHDKVQQRARKVRHSLNFDLCIFIQDSSFGVELRIKDGGYQDLLSQKNVAGQQSGKCKECVGSLKMLRQHTNTNQRKNQQDRQWNQM